MGEEKNISDFLAMNGGNGPLSYAKNSSYQKSAVDSSKAMLNGAIASNLHSTKLSSCVPFRIADFGCSIGPNTFIAVQNIMEAVALKYQSDGLTANIPEFQIFFNDLASNDFNTLFSLLPPNRPYFAAGVPGCFRGRLFPKSSLNFGYSSYALHWLSKLPQEVLDTNSSAWNKGRIHYTGASDSVLASYSTQFSRDMQSFLNARAEELASDGLMVLVVPVVPNGTLPSESFLCLMYDLLGFALMDMANMGLISEAKVHSFNLPIYYTSPRELEELVNKNGYFGVEKMIPMCNQMKNSITVLDYKLCILHIRVGTEQLIKEHFGSEIIEDLFHRFSEKVAAESPLIFKQDYLDNFVDLFVLLKRKVCN